MSHFQRSGRLDIRDTFSLMVININYRTTADDLFRLFAMYGEVADVFIPRDRRTGGPRGFAFVRYKYKDEASKAIEKLHGTLVDGRAIMVKFAEYERNGEQIASPARRSLSPRRAPSPIKSPLSMGGSPDVHNHEEQSMTVLSSKKILQEQNTDDPSSITSLILIHKALTDVSCLDNFKNLERLDLSFNNLTSLEGLKSCTNLKSLSVMHNRLQSLKGINGLNRLTVLNAGQNKLESMDDVKSVSSLHVLILNDNEISSVCKLRRMKELNTLVLSRNPIGSLGNSLRKLKSITKLSLSGCQLEEQELGSSLRFCVNLKELRLAENKITIIHEEFVHLVNLQYLDLRNNAIAKWSNLKVLSSLVNLRNLNLDGNPLVDAERRNLRKEVEKLLPNLHVLNAKSIGKKVAA